MFAAPALVFLSLAKRGMPSQHSLALLFDDLDEGELTLSSYLLRTLLFLPSPKLLNLLLYIACY